MYLICLALYYGVIVPVQMVGRAARALALATCVGVGAYIIGCFGYGVYLGITQ
jgi:hypothetical protein